MRKSNESKAQSAERKIKKAVRIRAYKTKIFNPKLKQNITYYRDDVIKNPWPELLEMAEKDKYHNTLIVIEL